MRRTAPSRGSRPTSTAPSTSAGRSWTPSSANAGTLRPPGLLLVVERDHHQLAHDRPLPPPPVRTATTGAPAAIVPGPRRRRVDGERATGRPAVLRRDLDGLGRALGGGEVVGGCPRRCGASAPRAV